MKSIQVFMILLCFSTFMVGCGGCGSDSSVDLSDNPDQEESESTSGTQSSGDIEINNLSDVMKEAEKALKNAGIEQGADPVNFRELKKVLPEELSGMEVTDQSGQTTGAMGFNISEAEIEFSGEDREKITIKILDTGGIAMAALSLAAWSNMTIDKEDSNGYERTTTIDGQKAYEKYNTKRNSGEISIFARDRYVITAEGRNVTMEQIQDAIKSVDVDELPATE